MHYYRTSGILATFLIWQFWQLGSKLPNFYHQIYIDLLTMLCPCCATAKFNSANIKFQPDLAKSPNLMIANMTGYTVCHESVCVCKYVCMCVCCGMCAYLTLQTMCVSLRMRACLCSYVCCETSVIRHLYKPTFSLIQPSYEAQSPYYNMLRITL